MACRKYQWSLQGGSLTCERVPNVALGKLGMVRKAQRRGQTGTVFARGYRMVLVLPARLMCRLKLHPLKPPVLRHKCAAANLSYHRPLPQVLLHLPRSPCLRSALALHRPPAAPRLRSGLQPPQRLQQRRRLPPVLPWEKLAQRSRPQPPLPPSPHLPPRQQHPLQQRRQQLLLPPRRRRLRSALMWPLHLPPPASQASCRSR